ncbi:iron-sulfur cluster biosynthesis family protein [Lactobacillus helveticus]|uniref:iron-sulfur cluster biosynthesis family protein n=1 Tax=Lactobacillus TaxID=1578 RepID=UPI0015625CEA|nr:MULTISPECIES: iron-sulfur cluster biosynthesis family protein [Lactobacillus]MCO0807882.1 iron-sulfur cluster biosynthesis family protein [Lactobacillus helveticus]MCP9317895.1 iron-sulfur cluster biosynthesis family protein [Lactobacillus helveticus]MDH5818237.1 iron-sulfur cluster biosynthesis family protein [Lactobacillus helveticus]MDN5955532.1 iron-sulfur cluster biosynthesis family protein [Lactobacillus sp.]MDN5989877.1 iron-sulfur cluster biosynthesis family protein [Lactobacillus s
MLKITFTDQALDYLKRREIANKVLILITDDGGGKYSIKGGGCSIGSHFSIIWVEQKDADYPVQLENDQGLKIYTSKYDMALMGPNMVMDYAAGNLNLRSDEGILDGGVDVGNGAALIKANKNVAMTDVEWRC